ncbi:MAG TPA: FG-GAP-like repeat-containing protein [Methylomirabilota bacterium]|nr:FG-GAP-like repeat-containing protein [Methylomirabilota bacterium]
MGQLRHNPRGNLWQALAMAGMLALAGGSPRAQSIAPAVGAQPGPRPPAQDVRRARQAYEQGLRAERAGDWEFAYAAQTEAEAYAPPVLEYQLHRALDRFRLVQQYTDRAEREWIANEPATARSDLLRALELDPGYEVAQERLAELEPQGIATAAEHDPKLAGAPRVQPQPGTRSFDYRGTTRGAYEEIGRQFGITASFDPELVDRQVRLRVPEVDFSTAMLVLGEETHTFWRAVDANTVFVAEDTPAKRKQYVVEIERSFILPASIASEQMNDTLRAVREIAGVSRAQLDISSRTLTLRDTPENIALAKALLDEIEQSHGELLLEIEILEVDHSLSRQLGITPPSSASTFTLSRNQIQSLMQAENNGTLIQAIEAIFASLNPALAAAGSSALFPSVLAFGGGDTTFLATVPGATANFGETLSQVRHAQRIMLRAIDGQPAKLFVGERYPITLAAYSASLGSTATQFSASILPGEFPRTDYATGTAPDAVITTEFTSDGKVDLATANFTANTVSILLGNGDGTFATHVDVAVGHGPTALVAADFNGDGKTDLAVTNQTDGTVSILLGNGDGTFATPTTLTLPTGALPAAILAGSFTSSGHVDLAVVNSGTNSVSIFLGNGDGTFAAPTTLTTGTTPVAIASGDFNADGHLDLAVVNQADNTVSIFLGNGDGTFKPSVTYATGTKPSGIAVADFNGDGRPDLVVTNQTDGTVSVLLGNGDGTFGAQTATNVGSGPVGIVEGDLAGNGLPAVAVANSASNSLTVLEGNGQGGFLGRLDISTGNDPVSIAAGVFSGSGTLDLAVAAESSNVVSVILNTSLAQLSPSVPLTSYPGSEYIDLGLKVQVTPRLNGDSDVTLHLQFDISSLQGSSVNLIPVLNNRTIDQTVRLRENQTSLFMGILQSNEMRAIESLPWVGQTAAGALLQGNNTQNSDSDFLILVTPRQLRLAPHSGRPIYAGSGESGPGSHP